MLRANEVIGIDLGTTNSCVAVMEGKVGRVADLRLLAHAVLKLARCLRRRLFPGTSEIPHTGWCGCGAAVLYHAAALATTRGPKMTPIRRTVAYVNALLLLVDPRTALSAALPLTSTRVPSCRQRA